VKTRVAPIEGKEILRVLYVNISLVPTNYKNMTSLDAHCSSLLSRRMLVKTYGIKKR
jgi:hypothetical protein